MWDLECGNWTTFVCGGIRTSHGFEVYRSADAMFRALLSLRGWVWAHNGGRYDTLWALEQCRKRGIRVSVTMAGARVVRAVIKDGPTLRDSFALIPMALKDAAKIGGGQKKETGLPCVCGKKCGGYCSIRPRMPWKLRRRLERYLEADCESLWNTLHKLRDFAACNGIELRGTVGSTAWATAKGALDLPDADWPNISIYRAARAGYYGGRTQVFGPEAPSGDRYDIHSSYPAALRSVAVPIGEAIECEPSNAGRRFRAGWPGVYTADVEVRRDVWIPPLPQRTDVRLLYPTGKFTGDWTSLELEYAESVGVRIHRIRHGLAWRRSERLFRQWCADGWKLRERAAADNKALGKWMKWLLNSLTGKLAMRPEVRVVSLRESDDPPEACPGEWPCSPTHCSGACGKWRLIAEGMDLWTRGLTRIASCGHVQMAAFLTAYARVELHRQLSHAGDAALYCDTDSVYARKPLARRLGDDLGEWGHEGSMSDWLAPAPKLYRYRDAKGKWHVKGKGMPGLTAEGMDLLLRGKMWERRIGVAGLSAAAKDGSLFERAILRRSLGREALAMGIVGDRWIASDGLTYPPCAA